jgi:predicted permease
MAALWKDFRYGFRVLRKALGFTFIAVLTIALGVSVNTTIFSWINSVLLNPLPGVPEPDRVVAMETVAPSGDPLTTSFLDYKDIRDNNRLLAGVALTQPSAMTVGEGRNLERAWGQMVTGNFFDILQLKPSLGRFFSQAEQDDAQNAHPVVVISHGYWKSRFRSDPNVAGKTVRINRTVFTIVGVAPPDFQGSMSGLGFSFWVPATMFGQLTSTGDWMLRDRKTRMFVSLARLKHGVELAQARQEVEALARRMAEANARTNQGISVTLLPFIDTNFGIQKTMRGPLTILMGGCAVVLLIVCANVANLLLARAAGRQKEFSIRVALGASRARIMRQLLIESLLAALAGSALGLLLTGWLAGAMGWMMPAASIPTLLQPPIDAGVLAFTIGLAFVVAIVAGLAPAVAAVRDHIADVLKEGGRSAVAASSHRLRGLLVISEVALAVVALIGAGLFVKSFRAARAINPGFDADHVAIATFSPATAGYTAEQADSFSRRLRERLQGRPGVISVAYADTVPLGFGAGSWEDLQIEGYTPPESENMKIYRTMVSPGYFDLMKIPLLEGRDFDLRDDAASTPVMIVNQEFVRRFVRGEYAIGRKVRGWGRWFTIVGVCRDSKYHQLTEAARPYFYIPIRQIYRPEMGLTFHMRTRGPLDQAIALLRTEGRALDPSMPVFEATALAEYIAASLYMQKVAATLLGALGVLALILAAIGLYGVLAYSVAQRTNEIGIRMTLGAEPGSVIRLVLREGLTFAGAGLAAGCVAAGILARLAASRLVAVSPLDPQVYLATGVFILLIAGAATALPALRALRVDPMVALRGE